MDLLGLECMAEFDEPLSYDNAFCKKTSIEEYEERVSDDTGHALKDLMLYLDKHQNVYANILQKKNQEDAENAGIFSFLKVKVQSALNGGVYPAAMVNKIETKMRLEEMKADMMRVYEYSTEANGTRRSKRIAQMRGRRHQTINDENTPPPGTRFTPAVLPPPAPPVPPIQPTAGKGCPKLRARVKFSGVTSPPEPPPIPKSFPAMVIKPDKQDKPPKPLQDKNVFVPPTPRSQTLRSKKHKRSFSASSASPTESVLGMTIETIQHEILTTNPYRRLKKTGLSRSPGGTPVYTPISKRMRRYGSATSLGSFNLNTGTPLYDAFMRTLEEKFKDTRSPSPGRGRLSSTQSPGTSFNNTFSFSD